MHEFEFKVGDICVYTGSSSGKVTVCCITQVGSKNINLRFPYKESTPTYNKKWAASRLHKIHITAGDLASFLTWGKREDVWIDKIDFQNDILYYTPCESGICQYTKLSTYWSCFTRLRKRPPALLHRLSFDLYAY